VRTHLRHILLSLLTTFLLPFIVATEARAGFVLPSEENPSSQSESKWLTESKFEKTITHHSSLVGEKSKHIGGHQDNSTRPKKSPDDGSMEQELANLFSGKAHGLNEGNSRASTGGQDNPSGQSTSFPTNHLPLPGNPTPANNPPLPPMNTSQGMGGNYHGFGPGSITLLAGLPSRPTVIGPELAIRLFAQESPLQMEEFAWRFFRPPRD